MSKGKFALGAVVAALSGFVAGVLTAPKSGKETRDDLKNDALKAKDTVTKEAEKAKELATEKVEEVKQKAEKTVKDVKAKAEAVADDVADQANDLKARAEQAVEGAKKGFNKKPATKTTKK